jgi:16S rRNA (uracil1498-N3)-methyltransferase
VGDHVDAVDPDGAGWRLTITRVGPTSCTAEAVPAEAPRSRDGPAATAAGPAVPGLVLMQCLPKARKMDLIVRQAVEAGAARIVPLVSDHAVARADEERARGARWERIAREAREQSGAARATAIEPAVRLDEAATRRRDGTAVFFHEDRAGAKPLHEILAEADGPVTVLVGPEGGLSPRETALLEAAGFRRAWLGDGVLRTETAALYALAAVATLLRERKTWKPSREG